MSHLIHQPIEHVSQVSTPDVSPFIHYEPYAELANRKLRERIVDLSERYGVAVFIEAHLTQPGRYIRCTINVNDVPLKFVWLRNYWMRYY